MDLESRMNAILLYFYAVLMYKYIVHLSSEPRIYDWTFGDIYKIANKKRNCSTFSPFCGLLRALVQSSWHCSSSDFVALVS